MVMNTIRSLLKREPRKDPANWTVVPGSQREIDSVVHYCRKMVSRRASMAAGVAIVPVPGIDWLTDVPTAGWWSTRRSRPAAACWSVSW